MRCFFLIICLTLLFGCTPESRNKKGHEKRDQNSDFSSLFEGQILLSEDFEFNHIPSNVFIENDIACKIIQQDAGELARQGKGVLISGIQNTKGTLTTKAIFSMSTENVSPNNVGINYSFMIPKKNIFAENNKTEKIILFRIRDSVKGRNLMTLEYGYNEGQSIIGGRILDTTFTENLSKGKWNDIHISTINEKGVTAVKVFLNNKIVFSKGYKELSLLNSEHIKYSFGQIRNWYSSIPSIIYFDRIEIWKVKKEI